MNDVSVLANLVGVLLAATEATPARLGGLSLEMPASYHLLQIAVEVNKFVWAFAFGACVGSLINVLAYRIPLGLDFVAPTSRCPSCDTRLTWRENVPVFGWLLLGGRCRFCKTPISAEYPIVEALVGLLWAVAFMVCYAEPTTMVGRMLLAMQPEWSRGGFVETWPIFIVLVTLLSSLVAMTLVDAKTFTIPPILTNVPTVVGLVGHVGFAVVLSVQGRWLTYTAPGSAWSIWTPQANTNVGWIVAGAALGAVVGLVLANVLLATGKLTRSFADYAEWEDQHRASQARATVADASGQGAESRADAVAEAPATSGESPADMWVAYPHARREMVRELAFLGPVVVGASIGAGAALWAAGPFIWNPNSLMQETETIMPGWLQVLVGVLVGYLVGGGVVWLMRILGTLGFGKEALGLGDVHMMAAVGACLGFIDPVLAFFGAAFLGMAWYVIGLFSSGAARRVMPFGPFLAMGTVLVFFAKPWLEQLVTWAMDAPERVNWP